MHNSKRSHRHVRLLAVLSIVMMLTSVFPWYPAAAEDPPATPPSLTSLSIACFAEGTDGIVATIGVANPPSEGTEVTATVELYANTSPEPTRLDPQDVGVVALYDTSVSVNVKLPANATEYGADTVIAKAFITGESTSVSSDSAGQPIYASGGVTLCGTAPVTTSLDEGSVSITASETSTTTASETATGSATASETATGTGTATTTGTATVTGTATATGTASDPAKSESSATATASATSSATATASATATTTATAAPTTQYATVVNTSGAQLRCRATPVNGTTLGMFAAGARVELRGAASNGWYPVVCPNGQDGHSSAEYLRAETSSTPTEPTPGDTSSGVAVVFGTEGAGLRCRTSPVSGSIIGVYPDGTRLTMRGSVENGWAPVTCGGSAGWVSTQYARVESGGGTTDPTPTPAPGTGTGKYGTVVNTGGQGLRCRTAPVSGAIILVAPEGTKLETRGAAVNNWYPVVCNGQAGHVSGDYFTLSTDGGTTTPPVSGGSSTAMVSGTGGGGLRCRTQPVDGATITVMPEGSLVDVRGSVVNGWAPVKCVGQNGWASAAYLNFNVSGGATGTLWMDVDLGDQYMRVYRGNTVIAQTYVSTGRPGFTTPTGNFYINHKLRSQTMSGVLGGEYYYVPNVPWVMYFTNVGHAIHGAYWHNNFGQVMSHGCVNLPVGFAEWLYSVTPYGALVRIHW